MPGKFFRAYSFGSYFPTYQMSEIRLRPKYAGHYSPGNPAARTICFDGGLPGSVMNSQPESDDHLAGKLSQNAVRHSRRVKCQRKTRDPEEATKCKSNHVATY